MDQLVRYQLKMIPEQKPSEEYFKIWGKTLKAIFEENILFFLAALKQW